MNIAYINLKSGQLSRLCPETSIKLYIHEFGFRIFLGQTLQKGPLICPVYICGLLQEFAGGPLLCPVDVLLQEFAGGPLLCPVL